MKRVLSGITSSNDPTIGNYIGAIRHWTAVEDTQDSFFFIANLHAITTRQDPAHLRDCTLNNVAWLLAAGLNPDRNTIFVQSQVSAHAELAWILNNYTMVGELARMTQYKDKTARFGSEGQVAGLFDYPVLMAADILLYDIDEVPVGHDQIQHIELTRDIAQRFNTAYGPTFRLPKPVQAEFGTRIMKLDNPEVKMSKSDPGPGTIYLSDSSEAISDKIKRAVTDSGTEVRTGADKPALTNLIQIYAAFSGQGPQQIEQRYKGKGYSEFKAELANLVVDKLTTLQTDFHHIRDNEKALTDAIEAGNAKARSYADVKLTEVKQKVGLL